MTAFDYQAIDAQGKTQKGTLEGESARQIRSQLRARGLLPLQIQPVVSSLDRDSSSIKKKSFFNTAFNLKLGQQKVSHAELTLMTRQLATLVSAGLPLEEALAGLVEQTEKPNVKKILAAIRSKVNDGYSLTASLEQFPDIFPKLYTASVSAGEHTGRLGEILLKLADHFERQYAIRQKVTQALVYPAMMLFIALSIVIFLLIYVVPKIIDVFQQDGGQELPFVTQMLLAISNFFQHNILYILILGVIGFLGFKYFYQQAKFRLNYEKFLLKLPFIGYLIKISNTAKFSRTLGILVGTGVSVLDSMYIALNIVEKMPIQEALKITAKNIKEGSAIHTAIKQTGYFNSMSIYLIANGEATGKLDSMLEKMADYQEQELVRIINIGLSLFEPMLILLMGVFTLFIVLAVLLPIFSYNQL